MEAQLADILDELAWQISECDTARSQLWGPEAVAPTAVTIRTQGDDFARDLREFRDRILLYSARPGSPTEQAVWLAPDQPLLWKFLTFCRPSARFVDPSHVRERLGAFLKVSNRGNTSPDDGSCTEDIWENRHIEQWITSGQPSMVFLEALQTTAPRARQFVLELIGHLEKHHPVVAMLGGLPPSVTDDLLPNLTPEAVLEQLTIQALHYIALQDPFPFVLDNLRSFKEAKGCNDWFGLLRKTCGYVPKVSFVIDLAAIPLRFQDAIRSWPMEFHKISEELSRGPTGTFVQVLLLGPRRMFAEHSSIGSVVSVRDAPESERRFMPPGAPKRLTPRPYEFLMPRIDSQTNPMLAIYIRDNSTVQDRLLSEPPYRYTTSTSIPIKSPDQIVEDLTPSAPEASVPEASAPATSSGPCIAHAGTDVPEMVFLERQAQSVPESSAACPSRPTSSCTNVAEVSPEDQSSPLPREKTASGNEAPVPSDLRDDLAGPSTSSRANVAEVSHETQSPSLPRPCEQQTLLSRKRPRESSDLHDDVESISKDRYQIKIALVCALPLEADAVQALFDEHWPTRGRKRNELRSDGDINAYSYGIMGGHPAVLVHMAGMGKSHGAMAATNCRNSFPNLKLALVVGICGGVPFYGKERREIVLGDVIVSEGLKHVDFGRRYPGGQFEMRDSAGDVFGRPPPELRSLLSKVKGRYGRRLLRERMQEHLRTLRRELEADAEYPGAAKDQVFDGTYVHRHNDPDVCGTCCNPGGGGGGSHTVCDAARSSSCEELRCDERRLVPRKRLDAIISGAATADASPAVHFGYIACADHVMKSGEDRDSIARDKGVIAFEMEGAGVWDMFPCLVIKAVCDYADSHKNKKWQNYAAATAAAYAKAFLEEWYM